MLKVGVSVKKYGFHKYIDGLDKVVMLQVLLTQIYISNEDDNNSLLRELVKRQRRTQSLHQFKMPLNWQTIASLNERDGSAVQCILQIGHS